MSLSNLDSVLVIIPVLNEEVTIATVIQRLNSCGLKHIRVVDNGSSDRTSEIAQKAGATVLFEPVTGYGRACWRGMQEMPESIQWVLFCDGDGSDDISSLPNLLELGDRQPRTKSLLIQAGVCGGGCGCMRTAVSSLWAAVCDALRLEPDDYLLVCGRRTLR